MEPLIAELIADGWLKTPAVISAFRAVDRRGFLPDEIKPFAYENRALPIGWGQTISQPLTVAFMLEELRPRFGEKVLDIGFGSGWQTALLAHIVGAEGTVCAIERILDLAAWGRANVERAGFKNVRFLVRDGFDGWPEAAPFDRLIAAARLAEIPRAWLGQVRIGGRIVAPVGDSIVVCEHVAPGQFRKVVHPGFIFVPFVHDKLG
ncbi:protein-L-isoaspartate O-methyltransferase [Candidatus Parcubacteria bacterium]|nr:protein-L-isoaspartate O-methyltransferase [Candidatus Parcubacteria bacterium]